MKMWHFEKFQASKGKPGEMETFMRDKMLPYFRSRGFNVHFFVTQHELGQGEFFFATEAASFSDLDNWPEIVGAETEGVELLTRLVNMVDGTPQASMLREIGAGSTPLQWDSHPMWHIEGFNSKLNTGELETHLVEKCLPYWRERGFTVHVMQSQLGFGERSLWLLTGVDHFGSLDKWSELALAEPYGEQIMNELVAMLRDKVGNLVRDVEA
ncbi:hypothetical protein [Peribacillus glennii]|uniref:NIPSNAP domain-containing protein n=1 Tax=Peribacillus glennii TaxID=2303991 RepID=A0A372LGS7_9BACI|nr:hypothetical protein [Peribacillus glennii]RFU65142.1 hypothetical protein D0466_04330 [Peribacillus glennii]